MNARRTRGMRRAWWLLVVAGAILLWPTRFGGATTILVVRGDSMRPTEDNGDLVIARKLARYERGDVIVFNVSFAANAHRVRVLHRIVSIDPAGIITTQGDNRTTADSFQTTAADVLGEARWSVPNGGYALWLLSRWWTLAIVGGALVTLYLLRDMPADEREDSDVAEHTGDQLARHAPKTRDLADAATLVVERAEQVDAGEPATLLES